MSQKFFKRKLISILVLSAISQGAFSQETIELGAVGSTGNNDQQDVTASSYQSPTQVSLDATEPKSIINQHYIEQNVPAAGNYSEIISIAPSVVDIAPNGPGLMESSNGGGTPTIRGFQDGQYNVTFDGIPIGDVHDFTHHSTSFFMNQDLGSIAVDRGPGDATNVGYATFGGTVALESIRPSDKPMITPFGSIGSWNTNLAGIKYDSGISQNYGDAKLYMSYKSLTSDGYLTDGAQRRQNYFLKFEKPLTDNTEVTFLSVVNKLHQNIPFGASLSQMAQYGINYSLNSNPASQNYYGYNVDNITTDLEYFGIKSKYQDWTFDNKLYTSAYYHDILNSGTPGANTDPNTFGTYVSVNGTITSLPNNVPGQNGFNNYRAVGDIFKVTKANGASNYDFGLWLDHQTNNRYLQNVDLTLGAAPNYGSLTGSTYVVRSMQDTLTTVQPYFQYEWAATKNITVTPGFKYLSFTRSLDAGSINSSTIQSGGSATWSKLVPTFNVVDRITNSFSIYGQYAQGFLAPLLAEFYSPKKSPNAPVNASQANPEQSNNYQVGMNYKTHDYALGLDVYKIDLTNYSTQSACGNGGVGFCYSNAGGVRFSGIETEGSVNLAHNLTFYGNYAINNYSLSADYAAANGAYLPNVPKLTGALGLIYNNKDYYASLITKMIGDRYTQDGNSTFIHLGSVAITNFAVGYKLPKTVAYGTESSLSLKVNNLLNRHDIYAADAQSVGPTLPNGNGDTLYYVVPERSYEIGLSVGF